MVAFIESRVTQSAKNTPPEVSQGTSDLPGSVLPLILKEVVDLFPPSAEITPESLLALLRKWGKKAKMPGPPTGKTWTDVEVVEILDSAEGSQGPEQGIPNIPKSQPLAARAIAAALAAAQKR